MAEGRNPYNVSIRWTKSSSSLEKKKVSSRGFGQVRILIQKLSISEN
jgi:hypothetical protein